MSAGIVHLVSLRSLSDETCEGLSSSWIWSIFPHCWHCCFKSW